MRGKEGIPKHTSQPPRVYQYAWEAPLPHEEYVDLRHHPANDKQKKYKERTTKDRNEVIHRPARKTKSQTLAALTAQCDDLQENHRNLQRLLAACSDCTRAAPDLLQAEAPPQMCRGGGRLPKLEIRINWMREYFVQLEGKHRRLETRGYSCPSSLQSPHWLVGEVPPTRWEAPATAAPGPPPVTPGPPPVTSGSPPVTSGPPPVTSGPPPVTSGPPPTTLGAPAVLPEVSLGGIGDFGLAQTPVPQAQAPPVQGADSAVLRAAAADLFKAEWGSIVGAPALADPGLLDPSLLDASLLDPSLLDPSLSGPWVQADTLASCYFEDALLDFDPASWPTLDEPSMGLSLVGDNEALGLG